MLNLDLLNKALARIEAEPHRWNQNGWVANEDAWDSTKQEELFKQKPVELCGTTMCLAGHTLLESGSYTLAWKKYDEHDRPYSSDRYIWFFNVIEGEWAPSADSDAAKALGLDPEDEHDATLIARLFLTTGYAKSSTAFAEYKERVTNAVQKYFVDKIADLERRLELEKQTSRPPVNDENLQVDPWHTDNVNTGANDEPPF